jgi:hypothetical protein
VVVVARGGARLPLPQRLSGWRDALEIREGYTGRRTCHDVPILSLPAIEPATTCQFCHVIS